MKQLSVEQAFGWAQAIAAREWRLLLPVALAFFALPGLMVDVFMPDAMQAILPGARVDQAVQGRAMLALMAAAVVNMAGWLAVTSLALIPGISVAEAIGRAARRLPALAGAVLLVTAGLVAAMLIVALLVGSMKADLGLMQRVLGVLVLVAGAVLYVRLAFLSPVLVERGGGPAPALARSWRLTQGAAWRVAGALGVYFVGGLVVVVALSTAVGAIITVAARSMGAGAVAGVLGAIVFRLVVALVSTGFQLLIAGLYRQVAVEGR